MLKTTKAVSKRVRVTKKGKLKRRPLGQNHYKAKLSGRENQTKKRVKGFIGIDERTLKRYIPYNN